MPSLIPFYLGDSLVKSFKNRLAACRTERVYFRQFSDHASTQKFVEISKEYESILHQQDDFWKQRAKQHWLQFSDSNSRFFHATATARKNNNSFSGLKYDSDT